MAALAAFCATGVVATSSATAATTQPVTKYHDRVVKAVNTVHAAERRLHKAKTPFGHNYTYVQWKAWAPRARLWHGHVMDPRWIIPAVFGKKAAGMALCIARAESHLNPQAYNSSSAAGLYQLMSFWYNGSSSFHWKFDPFNRWQNTLHAHMLYKHDGGWRQWYGDPCVS
jgi:hypothetical protein